jgi:hypothetical protein
LVVFVLDSEPTDVVCISIDVTLAASVIDLRHGV